MDIVNTFRIILNEYEADLHRRGVQVIDDCREAAIEINAEPVLIQDACRALIDNAVRFNRPNGKVIISLLEEADGRGMIVADSGIGMRPDQVKKINNRLSLSGLADVERLMRLTQGQWHMDSQHKVGTQVRLAWQK